MAYSFIAISKVKTTGSMVSKYNHNFRTVDVKNVIDGISRKMKKSSHYPNTGKKPPIFYYRDKDQKEIDPLIYQNGILYYEDHDRVRPE